MIPFPFSYGLVLTAAQWQANFDAKQDALGYTPVNRAGDTMLGPLITARSTAFAAGFNILQGTAPTNPNDGDIWTTVAGLFIRIDGVTYGPLLPGGTIVPTVAQLRALPSSFWSLTPSAFLGGYYALGDQGGGRLFYWDAASSEADNGGTIFEPDDAPATGRVKQTLTKRYNVMDFGAHGDFNDTTDVGDDDVGYLQKTADAIAVAGGGAVIIPSGNYLLRSKFKIPNGVTIELEEGAALWHGWDTGPNQLQTDEATIVAKNAVPFASLVVDPGPYDWAAQPGVAQDIVIRGPGAIKVTTASITKLDNHNNQWTATGNTGIDSTAVSGLSKNVNTAGWTVGMKISSSTGSLAGDTLIAAIAGDGLSLTLAEPAIADATGATLTVNGPFWYSSAAIAMMGVIGLDIDGVTTYRTPKVWRIPTLANDFSIRNTKNYGGTLVFEDGIHLFGGHDGVVRGNHTESGDDCYAVGTNYNLPCSDVVFSANTGSSQRGHAIRLFQQRIGITANFAPSDQHIERIVYQGLVGGFGLVSNGLIRVDTDPTNPALVRDVECSGFELKHGDYATHSGANAYGIILNGGYNLKFEGELLNVINSPLFFAGGADQIVCDLKTGKMQRDGQSPANLNRCGTIELRGTYVCKATAPAVKAFNTTQLTLTDFSALDIPNGHGIVKAYGNTTINANGVTPKRAVGATSIYGFRLESQPSPVAITGYTHSTKHITNLSPEVLDAGWAPGMVVTSSAGDIPGGATIVSIDPGGLGLVLSAAATGTNPAVTLTVTGYVPGDITGGTHSNTTVDGLTSNVILAGWTVGMAINSDLADIPQGTTIAAIAGDGLSLTLSQAATGTNAAQLIYASGVRLLTSGVDFTDVDNPLGVASNYLGYFPAANHHIPAQGQITSDIAVWVGAPVISLIGEGGVSDNLTTLSGCLTDGTIVELVNTQAYSITVKHANSANKFNIGSDIVLDSSSKGIVVILQAGIWQLVSVVGYGGVSLISKATNYTVLASDVAAGAVTIEVDASGGALTVTIPPTLGSSVNSPRIVVQKIDTSANSVSISDGTNVVDLIVTPATSNGQVNGWRNVSTNGTNLRSFGVG